jgi:aspartate racemase
MRTLGIIGGAGPASSAELYLKLTEKVHHDALETRPHILLDSMPLPIQMEKDLILDGITEPYIPYLQDSARKLEESGAELIVLACNTLHLHEDSIRSTLNTAKFISLRDIVPQFLSEKGVQRIGILGTRSVATKLYKDLLREHGIEQVVPCDALQTDLDLAIQHIVTDQWGQHERDCVQAAMHQLEKFDADALLLACTDLWQGKNRPSAGCTWDGAQDCTSEMHTFDTVDLLTTKVVEELLMSQ